MPNALLVSRVLSRARPAQLMAAHSTIPQEIQTVEMKGREQTEQAKGRERMTYKPDTCMGDGRRELGALPHLVCTG